MEITRLDFIFGMSLVSCLISLYLVWQVFSIKSFLLKSNLARSHDMLDAVLSDLKRATEGVQKLKKVSENHSQLIIKLFQILKDSIERDMTQTEVLRLINELGLPLNNDKEPKVE